MEKNNINEEMAQRPSNFWLATEIARAITEVGISIPFRKWIKTGQKGDGHPVLVLPGFMASDVSTTPLRKYLAKIGYNAIPWEFGRNIANINHLKLLVDKLDAIHEEYGEDVSIIGWSLGGVYARQIAKKRPHLVRQVITLGSPFRGVNKANNAAWIYDILIERKKIEEAAPELLLEFPKPAPVPTTAIYSKEDGIVPWELCMEEEETYYRQNIQVRGSHLGLGINPSVLKIITDRLQYTEATWQPFVPQNVVEDFLFYPSL